MKIIKTASIYTTSLGLLYAGTLPSVALGQESISLEEIIVTAQKREQSVQDVPIAISAFDGEFINETGVSDILELQAFVPGLSVYSEYSTVVPTFNIRGLGTTSTNLALESSVGIYVDGVYRSRQNSGINDLVDIERVEVLKGPQGTLFGKNTIAGAVQFLTVAPKLDEFGGFAEVRAGSDNLTKFNGAVNIPLVEGRAAARISGGIAKRDGYVENIVNGEQLNDKDRVSVRGQLLFNVNDSLTARIIADYSKVDEICCGQGNTLDGPLDTIAGFNPAAGAAFPLQALTDQLVLANDFDRRLVAFDETPFVTVEESGVSLELKWGLEDMTFTSLTSYRNYEAVDSPPDGTAIDLISAFDHDTEQETFTQEFRLDGTLGENINYTTGLYYFDQELDDDLTIRLGSDLNTFAFGGARLGDLDALGFFGPAGVVCSGMAFPGAGVEALCGSPAFPGGEGGNNLSNQRQTSWAAFGQMDIKVSEKLVATLGLRYLEEEKDLDVMFTETIFTPTFAALSIVSPLVPDVQGVSVDDDVLTGTAKLSYFWNDDVMTYASYGRGYKSGGTNIERIPLITGAQQLFDPESLDSFEIGIKADFLDSRLRINAAAFLMQLDDFQANNLVGNTFVLQNAGSIETKGLEVDVTALPASWLRVSSGFAYIDAIYDDFQTGGCAITPFGMSPDAAQPGFPDVCDVTGDRVGGTPEWSAYTSIRTEHELNKGLFYTQFDINWRDETLSGIDSSGDPNLSGDSVTLANLRAGYRFGEDQRYDLSFWSTNVFDEAYQTVSFDATFRTGTVSSIHTEPRMLGVTFKVDY